MQNILYNLESVTEQLKENPINPATVKDIAANMNAVDIADIFDDLNTEKVIQLFRWLPKDMAADVFSYVEPDKQKIIIESLTDAEVGKIVGRLFADDAVDFLEEMPANVVTRVLQNVTEGKRQLINQLLMYPDDSAGSVMTTEFVDLKEDMSVEEAFKKIRKIGLEKETIYTCYVLRRDRLLVGVVSAMRLMVADPGERIGDIMDTSFMSAHTTDDREEVAGMFSRYGLLSMPIVDNEHRLVGIVTIDDVMQIIEEEATEDIEIMGALRPAEKPYLKTSILGLSRNRIPWLMVLMLSATLTGSILSHFEDALMVIPALMFFVPMLMDSAGNSGAQASVLIIRGMAVGELMPRDFLKILWREIRVGVICGFTLGIVNFVRVYLMYGQDYMLTLTVTVTLIIVVIVSKSVGCLLPLAGKRIGLDPAVMAAPIITTIVDAGALIIYFLIASSLMGL